MSRNVSQHVTIGFDLCCILVFTLLYFIKYYKYDYIFLLRLDLINIKCFIGKVVCICQVDVIFPKKNVSGNDTNTYVILRIDTIFTSFYISESHCYRQYFIYFYHHCLHILIIFVFINWRYRFLLMWLRFFKLYLKHKENTNV